MGDMLESKIHFTCALQSKIQSELCGMNVSHGQCTQICVTYISRLHICFE